MSLKIEACATEKIPPILDKLSKEVLSQNKAVEFIQKDLFYVLIIVLLLENGFLPIINGSEILEDINSYDFRHLTNEKFSTGLYGSEFVLSGFNDLPFKLIVSPLGALMLVNLIFKECAETYSVCLPISRYIVSPHASTIPMIFHDLKHLSNTFKSGVLSAVKSKILNFCGRPSASLIGLPDEIIVYNVLLYLPLVDVINVSKTCKRLKEVVNTERLWRELYKRDFKNITFFETHYDWKIQYKKSFLTQQEKIFKHTQSLRSMLNYRPDSFSYLDDMNMALYFYNPLPDVI